MPPKKEAAAETSGVCDDDDERGDFRWRVGGLRWLFKGLIFMAKYRHSLS
jgi:hypothetical protein